MCLPVHPVRLRSQCRWRRRRWDDRVAVLGLVMASACTPEPPLLATADWFVSPPADSGVGGRDSGAIGGTDTGVGPDVDDAERPPGSPPENWEFAPLGTSIWTSLMTDGEAVWVATLQGKRTLAFDISDGIEELPNPVELMPGDAVDDFTVTDISLLYLGDRFIVAASDPEATGMILGAYGPSGVELVPPRRIITGSDAPTNDMKLVYRGDEVHVSHGADGPEKRFMVFTPDLVELQAVTTVVDPAYSSQLGCAVATDEGFLRVAGNYRNHGLVGARFDPDWQSTTTDDFLLPIPAEPNEWLWFSSGCARDPKTGVWYVAHQHMFDGDNANSQSCIQVSRFDASWQYLDTHELTARAGYTRPQLVIRADDLFVSFDRGEDDVQVAHARLDPDR